MSIVEGRVMMVEGFVINEDGSGVHEHRGPTLTGEYIGEHGGGGLNYAVLK